MVISILAVGRSRSLEEPIRDYEKRAKHYWRLRVDEVPRAKERDPERAMAEEAGNLEKRIDPRFTLVALTREGRTMSSAELARWLEKLAVSSTPGVHFAIGGAHGLGSPVLERADLALSLSPMTLPHEVAHLVLAEQIYRAGTILRNEPYHKGSR